MNQELLIRTAGKGDIIAIEKLAREIWPDTYGDILTPAQLNYMLDYFYTPAALENQMTNLNHHFIISLLNNEPVGFASWSLIDKQGIYKLHKLYVHGKTQGKGIGKKLVDHILGSITKENAIALRLNVNRHNKARFFYEKSGFTIIGEEDADLGNGVFQNDYIMEKKITSPA